jgi:subtilase family serine protease
LAQRRTDSAATTVVPAQPGTVSPDVASTTLGNDGAYDPSYLQSAYDTPSSSNGVGQTVAIVDAYDDPNAAADLSSYRSFFGLPACTTATGCFRKVSETGGTKYPAGNTSWGQEISLDLDMVSAICPNCHILLVEASSNSIADLGASVNEAVALGANVVSNSYGGPEYSGDRYPRRHRDGVEWHR